VSETAPPDSAAPQRLSHLTLMGLIWTLLGTGSQLSLQLVAVLVLARILTPRDFGVVAAALVVVGFSATFSRLGVGPAIVQRPALNERHLATGFTLSILSGALMGAAIFAAAPGIAAFFKIPELVGVVRALSVKFVLEAASVMPESLLQRELKFKRLSTVELIAFAVGFAGTGVGLALAGAGIWALTLAYLGQALVRSIILIAIKPHPMRPAIHADALKDLMYFGGGFTAARIGNYIGMQGDKMVVGRWLGAEPLGVYGRAYQLMVAPANDLGSVIDNVLFPAMAQVQGSRERLRVGFRRGIASVALLMLPLGIVCFVLAPEIIHLLLGPRWTEAVEPFRYFALGLLFRTSYKMSDSISRATGSEYRRAWRQWVYATLVTGGAWIGSTWGLTGAAAAVLIAIGANYLLMAHLSLSVAEMRWAEFFLAQAPALILAAAAGAVSWGVASWTRGAGFGVIATLALTLSACALATLGLLRFLPRVVLGRDGLWMLRTFAGFLPGRRNPILWIVRESGT